MAPLSGLLAISDPQNPSALSIKLSAFQFEFQVKTKNKKTLPSVFFVYLQPLFKRCSNRYASCTSLRSLPKKVWQATLIRALTPEPRPS